VIRVHVAGIAAVAALLCVAAGAAEPARPLLVTVDDLPIQGRDADPASRARITRELLAALAKHRIQAVGLVTWNNLRAPEEEKLLDAWLDAGHELGNHSFAHLDYTRTSIEDYLADVERGRAELARLLAARGRTLRWFRFPFLREGDTPEKLDAMRAWLARTGQRNLPVTIDNQDWSFDVPWRHAFSTPAGEDDLRVGERYQSALRLAVEHHARHGDALLSRSSPQILLLHANAVGTAQWDALFGWLTATGHRFATADEVLADPAFALPHRFVSPYGPSLWDRLEHEREWQEVQADVRALLSAQAADWSRGDIEAFCSVYTEDTAFVAADGLTRGREAIVARYRERYPDGAAMGRLDLEVVELRELSGTELTMLGDATPGAIHAVSLVARWRLQRQSEAPLSGLTLLVLHRRRGEWKIVQDASL
jgi:uncharacterized protein (TIGR02246 family)